MAMIVLLSAKGAPGVTTTTVALATAWPSPVVVADCDPAGGDLASGWLAPWSIEGWFHPERGVLSFVMASRHGSNVDVVGLAQHLQYAPNTPTTWVLAGLPSATQPGAVDESGWQRLADALGQFASLHDPSVDVLVDAGRYGPATPWPLLRAADLVLLAVRPRPRHIQAARPLATSLVERLGAHRLRLAVCASDAAGRSEAQRVLGLPSGVDLPCDPRAAGVFSDADDVTRSIRRSPLVRAATRNAIRLHKELHQQSPHPADEASAEADDICAVPVEIGAAR